MLKTLISFLGLLISRSWILIVLAVALTRIGFNEQPNFDPPHKLAKPHKIIPATKGASGDSAAAKEQTHRAPARNVIDETPAPSGAAEAQSGQKNASTIGQILTAALDAVVPPADPPMVFEIPPPPVDLALDESAPKAPIPSGENTSAPIRLIKALAYKTMILRDAKIVSGAETPAMRMALRDYLSMRLGGKFHFRKQWAGSRGRYLPQTQKPRRWTRLGEVNYLTIHHSEGIPAGHPAQMIRLIYKGHTQPGGRLYSADVGYHFFVDRNGEVWEGRDASMMGTHVGSTPRGENNAGNLGICGLGTFKRHSPPRAMADSIVHLSELISQFYGRPLTVRGHKDWVGIHRFHPRGGVDCPGRLEASVVQARQSVGRLYARVQPDRALSSRRPRTAVVSSVGPAPPSLRFKQPIHGSDARARRATR